MKLKNKFVALVTILVFALSATPSFAGCGCKKNHDQQSSNVHHSKKHHHQAALHSKSHKQVALSATTPSFQAKQLNEPPQTIVIQ